MSTDDSSEENDMNKEIDGNKVRGFLEQKKNFGGVGVEVRTLDNNT